MYSLVSRAWFTHWSTLQHLISESISQSQHNNVVFLYSGVPAWVLSALLKFSWLQFCLQFIFPYSEKATKLVHWICCFRLQQLQGTMVSHKTCIIAHCDYIATGNRSGCCGSTWVIDVQIIWNTCQRAYRLCHNVWKVVAFINLLFSFLPAWKLTDEQSVIRYEKALVCGGKIDRTRCEEIISHEIADEKRMMTVTTGILSSRWNERSHSCDIIRQAFFLPVGMTLWVLLCCRPVVWFLLTGHMQHIYANASFLLIMSFVGKLESAAASGYWYCIRF